MQFLKSSYANKELLEHKLTTFVENICMNLPDIKVLLYHRVVRKGELTGKHKIYVNVKRFEEQMQYLKDHHFETLTFYDVAAKKHINSGKPSVIITFDDGYADNYFHAFPILKKFNFKAVVFLVTQKIYNEWGVTEGEPQLSLMSRDMIREMADYGLEFGGHTQSHVDLKTLNTEEIKSEILNCKKDVEGITGKNAISFAYPFGGLNDEIKQITKEAGYNFGIATKYGPPRFHDDYYQIKRQEINPGTRLWSFKRKCKN